ncbi:hypothetical protein [Natronococcus pandeyae]|uniref:hypothetical protein n=1 Tax=Natronococcus pandeyae TaxID=2055836 RepID=UPI001F1D8B73|nr:hypothetical protein [Natronococcus pandeyae]
MIDVPKLDAYHLYEREWDSYEQLKESFEWELPEEFNVAAYACDRWAETDPDRVALYIEKGPRDRANIRSARSKRLLIDLLTTSSS